MGKELVFKTLKHEETSRPPWVPFAGIHAGKLLGYNAIELLTDEDKLVESLLEVNKLYKPDGQPVLFDLQIEKHMINERSRYMIKAITDYCLISRLATYNELLSSLNEKTAEWIDEIFELNKIASNNIKNIITTTNEFKLVVDNLVNIEYLRSSSCKNLLQNVKNNDLSTIGADIYRDEALKVEKSDLELAMRLIKIARRIRPDGYLIIKKYEEYKRRLEQ